MPEIHDVIVRVPLDKLQSNQYNPNVMPDSLFEELLNDIRQNGFLDPIIARPNGDGSYQIVDGEHRFRASKQLGMTEIPVIVREMDEDTAKINTFRWNHERGFFDTVKTGDLIWDLRQRHSIDQLVKSLGVNHEEMVQYLRPAEIPAAWHIPVETSSYGQPEEREPLVFYLKPEVKQAVTEGLDGYRKDKALKSREEALVRSG